MKVEVNKIEVSKADLEVLEDVLGTSKEDKDYTLKMSLGLVFTHKIGRDNTVIFAKLLTGLTGVEIDNLKDLVDYLTTYLDEKELEKLGLIFSTDIFKG